MAHTRLTDVGLRHFEELLRAQRADIDTELLQLTGTLDDVRSARGDTSADDEHDPEGPTLSMEWSKISGIQNELARTSAAIDAALARIDDGTYGICTRRGEVIGRARLEARPAAELCIDCARELESQR
ncbi:TraR/DksA family transcriptional regulator [Glaciibacter superstes]|uniref:TraR/DksA family transcriptional regulator n=1 Tax=Glaciibacter superstes TaxID=501023 RepID=UPI0003B50DC1|nr:TraR/DksA C4-type zinc finger protein [Glaciibacter superstes]